MKFHVCSVLDPNKYQQFCFTSADLSNNQLLTNVAHLPGSTTDANQGLSIFDRALNYADGCFTTIYADVSHISLFEQHIGRLENDCKVLGISLETTPLAQALVVFSKRLIQSQHGGVAIKVIVSRGVGGRGYDLPSDPVTQIIISYQSCTTNQKLNKHTDATNYQLALASMRLSSQPKLDGLKHLNRLEQVLAKQELAKLDSDDLVLCDNKNNMVEATAANLFYFKQGVWYTPTLNSCGVSGIMRKQVIQFFHKQGIKFKIEDAPFEALLESQAIFLCNALKQIIPITHVVSDDKKRALHMEPILEFSGSFYEFVSRSNKRLSV